MFDRDPVTTLVSDLLNYPNGLPDPRELEPVEMHPVQDTTEEPNLNDNIRIAVELLLGAKKGSPDYAANLEIAKGYILKELANS
jgi:hypothetical protein